MQDLDGHTVYSATDLVGFLACEHLTTLDRAEMGGLLSAEDRVDEELEVLRERGEEHERRYLAFLRDQGRKVVDGRHPKALLAGMTDRQRLEADADLTKRLMRDGADVIYQATLFDGTWRGYADFLVRVDGPSDLGSHHYEVADTKLARRTKGGALLQMCVYSELVATVQGRMPTEMHVALGGSGHQVDTHRLDDYLAYYRSVKSRFLEVVVGDRPLPYPLPTTPEPVSHCEVCRWLPTCAALRRDADHLSLVASMRSDQARRLREAGIGTLTELALASPMPEVDKLGAATMSALQQQARLQLESRGLEVPKHEFLPLEKNRGLSWLPAPSRGDLFFDIEGDPFAEEDGLEYLFGVWDPAERQADGTPTYRAWWAHSRQDEKAAFEGFIDFVMARWRDDPDMHVYHYAAYERGRMGMLSTRHGTREAEVDRMLRCELFADLYKVVRQGMRIGLESYSIKKLEPLYALDREAEMKEAGSSVVAYERYIKSVSTGMPDTTILDEIRLYNQDDCRSNAALRDWLEEQRRELARQLGLPELDRRTPDEEERDKPQSERDARIERLVAQLLDGVPTIPERRASDPDLQGRWLLANLLEWHRREEKVDWWAFFDRCSRSDEELASNDEEAIGQLTWLGEVAREARSVVHRYAFDPEQSYRLKVGDEGVDPATRQYAGKIVALDPLIGTLELKTGTRKERPRPRSLIPHGPIVADAQKGALERLGGWVVANRLSSPGPWQAARSFLLGERPRAGQALDAPILPVGSDIADAAMQAVLHLDQSALPVQGPPGSGKTHLGADMVLALVRAGRKVGIVAFTHRALTNLLDEVLDHAEAEGLVVDAIRKVDRDEPVQETWRYSHTTDNAEVAERLRAGSHVAAGTAWMWASPDLEDAVDTLFVDEAGQMSLANVVSVSGAARNLVLLGDPQQLSQVKKGAHPEGVDLSALEHVLKGQPVIDDQAGIFLPHTHRLHRDVNAFTSEIFYARRLESAPEANGQAVVADGLLTGTGVRWIAAAHAGNRNSSEEEARAVRDLYADLLGGQWTNERGVSGPLTPANILVVAPYNAQVELLTERLAEVAEGAMQAGPPRVGTVDKIQGQQAAAVIYSMATSSQDEMPRTMEFLFSLNRLNVATSRGRCLAAIVCSPDLLQVRAHTPMQMKLANALCRFVELAAEQAARQSVSVEMQQLTLLPI